MRKKKDLMDNASEEPNGSRRARRSGRVNFAVRSAAPIDLLAFLRGLGLGHVDGEFANGHPRATGGSIPPHEFARLLNALHFGASPLHASPP